MTGDDGCRDGSRDAWQAAWQAEAVRVRALEAADLKQVIALADALPAAPRWSVQAWQQMLAAGVRVMLVAEVGVEVVGFCVASVVMDTADLETIAVKPATQRHGVGWRLLAAAMEACAAAGARRMLLEVRASNVAAQRLYARAGFVESGRRRSYYRQPVEDAMGMERELEPTSAG